MKLREIFRSTTDNVSTAFNLFYSYFLVGLEGLEPSTSESVAQRSIH